MYTKMFASSLAALQRSLVDVRHWWAGSGREVIEQLASDNLSPAQYTSPLEWEKNLDLIISKAMSSRVFTLVDVPCEFHRIVENRGRILVFEPLQSMHDGLAAQETRGLVDVHNCPLSQFWLGTISRSDRREMAGDSDNLLVCWVPDELVDRMSNGMRMIAEQCLNWVDDEKWRNTGIGQLLTAGLV